MEISAFEAILHRTAKELNCADVVTKAYSNKLTFNILNENIEKLGSLSIRLLVNYSEQLLDLLNNVDETFYDTVNNLMYEFSVPHILNFLAENDILPKFEKNVAEMAFVPTEEGKICKTVEELIDTLRLYGYSPFDIIGNAFTWRATPEGFEFWVDVHKKYRKLLSELFFATK